MRLEVVSVSVPMGFRPVPIGLCRIMLAAPAFNVSASDPALPTHEAEDKVIAPPEPALELRVMDEGVCVTAPAPMILIAPPPVVILLLPTPTPVKLIAVFPL